MYKDFSYKNEDKGTSLNFKKPWKNKMLGFLSEFLLTYHCQQKTGRTWSAGIKKIPTRNWQTNSKYA